MIFDDEQYEAATDVCAACGQPTKKKAKETHVYAVKLEFGSGRKKWCYSLAVSKEDAQREARELKATGYEALAMTVDEAEKHRAEIALKRRRR